VRKGGGKPWDLTREESGEGAGTQPTSGVLALSRSRQSATLANMFHALLRATTKRTYLKRTPSATPTFGHPVRTCSPHGKTDLSETYAEMQSMTFLLPSHRLA